MSHGGSRTVVLGDSVEKTASVHAPYLLHQITIQSVVISCELIATCEITVILYTVPLVDIGSF